MGLLKQYPEVAFDLEAEEKKWMDSLECLRSLEAINGEYYIQQALKEDKKILAEGAQGSMLDIDFGTYPFVTSSNTIASGVCSGLGIAPGQIGEVIGITKAYCTRVGSGPFPTELEDATGEELRAAGSEFGATTGRPRRCGWLDLPQLNYTIMLNGVTQLVITKIDVLNEFEEIAVAVAYQTGEKKETEELPFDLNAVPITPIYHTLKGWKEDIDDRDSFGKFPVALQDYIAFVEERTGVEVSMVSTGPGREQLILAP
jgi:adenylosuccinate synthase